MTDAWRLSIDHIRSESPTSAKQTVSECKQRKEPAPGEPAPLRCQVCGLRKCPFPEKTAKHNKRLTIIHSHRPEPETMPTV